jgi:hypothetical protein
MIPGTTFPVPTQKPHPMYPGCSFSVISVLFGYPVPGIFDGGKSKTLAKIENQGT